MKYIVITNIHGKTPAIELYERMTGWRVLVVGDANSTPITSSDSLTFLSLKDQQELGFSYVQHCPENHYARKNIGYLYALREGAEVIFDTDDDNVALPQWHEPSWSCSLGGQAQSSFGNVYRYFGDTFCWPRGFPLDAVHDQSLIVKPASDLRVDVWQSLADSDPDVDAIYRLLHTEPVFFRDREPFALQRGTYCPFNSQCTFWRQSAFPLLYLPSSVTFRFTDILRGYVAQRLLWQQDAHLGFLSPIVRQDRNAHDLLDDFASEIPCYLQVRAVTNLLGNTDFTAEHFENMQRAYAALFNGGIVSAEEIAACTAWLADMQQIMFRRTY